MRKHMAIASTVEACLKWCTNAHCTDVDMLREMYKIGLPLRHGSKLTNATFYTETEFELNIAEDCTMHSTKICKNVLLLWQQDSALIVGLGSILVFLDYHNNDN